MNVLRIKDGKVDGIALSSATPAVAERTASMLNSFSGKTGFTFTTDGGANDSDGHLIAGGNQVSTGQEQSR